MNFFPNNIQVLWQPVPIQNIQNQTIDQLRRQNQMLKSQLSNYIHMQNNSQNGKSFVRSGIKTDRCSFGSPQYYKKDVKQNNFFSPKMFNHHHQRISSIYSPQQRFMASQNNSFKTHRYQKSMIVHEPIKRMVIQKTQNGKYYRNKMQQNKQQSMCSNAMSCHTKSQYIKTNASTQDSGFKSPMKASQHYARFSDIEKEVLKNGVQRVKSPNFFRNKQKQGKAPLFETTNLQNRAKMSHSQWNQSTIKPVQKSQGDEYQELNIDQLTSINDQRGDTHRNTAKIPTIALSAESDSDISIQKVVKQIARKKPQQKKVKQQKRDTLIFQMQQKLQNLYGERQQC